MTEELVTYGVKDRIGHLLLSAARIARLHIIGCSRSGTTMLQYSMIAFRDTIIVDDEKSIGYPYLRGKASLFLGHVLRPGKRHLVTKRPVGWHQRESLADIVQRSRREKIGLLNLIRDPRDVLTSRHRRQGDDKPYVTPELWLRSIEAGQSALEAVEGQAPTLTLRFEDIVRRPGEAERLLGRTFGLVKRPDIESMAKLKTNIEKTGYRLGRRAVGALHTLRDMEEGPVQRWKRTHPGVRFEVDDPVVQDRIDRFLLDHEYD